MKKGSGKAQGVFVSFRRRYSEYGVKAVKPINLADGACELTFYVRYSYEKTNKTARSS